MKSRSRIRFMPIGWRVSTSQNNHNVALGLELFLYLFSSKNGIFHKFLYRTFWYSRNYTYFYFPKWRYKPRMVLKITNLHILRYLPTCWLYLLERYTIDNQRYTHTASGKEIQVISAFYRKQRRRGGHMTATVFHMQESPFSWYVLTYLRTVLWESPKSQLMPFIPIPIT